MNITKTTGRQAWHLGAGVASAAGLLGTLSAALGGYFANRVITPGRPKPNDVHIHSFDLSANPPWIALGKTEETVIPGRYGLWLDNGAGHLRVGEILTPNELPDQTEPDHIYRRVHGLDGGNLSTGMARWNQYYHCGDPHSSLGLQYENLQIESELGSLPTWYVPAGSTPTRTCAVLVHGLTATRQECLRAVPALHQLGLDVLIPSYRNDQDAPADPSGRYQLGDAEWRDVHCVMQWALAHGAQEFLLIGWSMGGAIVLATAQRSTLAPHIRALVLDGPVIDWQHVLDHNASLHHVPIPINRVGQWLLRNRFGHRAVGLTEPLDLRRLDTLATAAQLQQPILLIHSDADTYVPNGPSLALAAARPDLVTLVPWQVGRHTKEWNTDPQRWEGALTEFVLQHLTSVGAGPHA